MVLYERCARDSDNRLGIVVAPPGCGKTEVLGRFARTAAAEGAVVLRAAGERVEQGVPFAVMEQLAESVADAGTRDALHAALAELADTTAQTTNAQLYPLDGPTRNVPLGRMCRLLAGLTLHDQLVIVIDDVHYADRPSLELLVRIGRRLPGIRLAVVVAVVPELVPAYPDLSVYLHNLSHDRICLPRLDCDEIRERAAAADGDHPALTLSGGNPALVAALIADHEQGARPCGENFNATISAWVRSQEQLLVDIASLLAMVECGQVATALGVDRDTVDRALRLLEDTGLAGENGHMHAAVRTALLRALAPEHHTRLRLAAAEAVRPMGDDAVAAELTAAGSAPMDWMFAALWRATNAAIARDQLDAAIRYDQPALLDWRTGAARTLLHLGRIEEAAALVREVLDWPVEQPAGVRGLALHILATTLEPSKQLPLLDESIRLLQSESGNRLDLQQALLDLGRINQLFGKSSRARQPTERVGNEFVSIPASPTQIAGPMNAPERLTEAERRVASLAAKGYSNSAIAHTLFITVSTVEQHLTKVYRKLNISKRKELTALYQ
jgi:DNA-binding CsgD family transcriptional regulator